MLRRNSHPRQLSQGVRRRRLLTGIATTLAGARAGGLSGWRPAPPGSRGRSAPIPHAFGILRLTHLAALNQGRADESVAEVDDGLGDFIPPTAKILLADLTLRALRQFQPAVVAFERGPLVVRRHHVVLIRKQHVHEALPGCTALGYPSFPWAIGAAKQNWASSSRQRSSGLPPPRFPSERLANSSCREWRLSHMGRVLP